MKSIHARRSILLAAGLTAAVVAWMATGLLVDGEPRVPSGTPAPNAAAERVRSVAVLESVARPVMREIAISARSEPNRTVEIAAETEGRIVSIDAERGARVEAGERIAAIDMRDRETRVREAEALVAQRELEFRAAERLRGRDLMSEAQIAEVAAQLEAARSALERMRLDVEHTSLEAPFDGVLAERAVELGAYVGIGDPVGTVVDTDPLIIVGNVSETEIRGLDIGSAGTARLRSGEAIEGTVRYIAPVAAESTRTFRVELAIPNPDGRLRAGGSAEVRLPAGEIVAHRLTPALLTLDGDGNVGIKAVGERNTVQFHPIEIVRSGDDGIWVTGLPERLRVISVGQGFVAVGETVKPVPAQEAPRAGGRSSSGSSP